MAKADPSLKTTTADSDAAGTTANRTAAAPLLPPPLGTSCLVRVAEGATLLNNETGAHFEPGIDTPVTCTVTLLRRLQDGDLVLVG